MNRLFKLILLVIVLFSCFETSAYAQRRKSTPKKVVEVVQPVLVDSAAYVDSLRWYKAQLDSICQAKDSLESELNNTEKYYRMFSPLAYYPNVIGKKIEGGDENSIADDEIDKGIEQALLNIYLNHPEYVVTTVNKLHASASKANEKPDTPVRRKVEVIKEEAPIEEEGGSQGPVDLFVYKPNFWKFSGDYSLQFMQNHISENWYKGGESNLSMIGNVVLQLNYDNKKKLKIENKLEMKLGFQTSESDTLHKFKTSSDMLRYTGKVGIQATKDWYYTFQTIVATQFAYGLKSNDKKIYSDFMSPLTANLSLGMDYNAKWLNNKLTGNAHIAPLAFNWKYVGRVDLATRYGINEGQHTLEDFGSQLTVNLTWKPVDNFKWQTRFYAYTTYHRAEVEWENTITFAFSKYISSTLFLHPRFDDGVSRSKDVSLWQFKEYFSLGFSYNM